MKKNEKGKNNSDHVLTKLKSMWGERMERDSPTGRTISDGAAQIKCQHKHDGSRIERKPRNDGEGGKVLKHDQYENPQEVQQLKVQQPALQKNTIAAWHPVSVNRERCSSCVL
ncbi:hypothetical protein RvY_06223 [Ramazzottius varieornatus]|uniref:Uncharacterized protein n=1 Tax=Ramazzottius varieornatus TaxID=947166 RepID=A0A1D1V3A4_RAMVA|nr:hypothetical protein RvY_06223 [Ramazzottius varieornatus]